MVELKRMYEPNPEDQLWTLTQNYMHAPVEWKLYDLSGVHHVTAKDKEIFMLVEKDYPLRRGLALVMISYRLQVENNSQMAEDLIRNIYNIANTTRKQRESSHWQYKFPLPVKVVPTARRLEMPLSGVCTAIEEMMKKLPVIEFEDSYVVPASSSSTTTTDTTSGETGTKSGRTVTLTAEDMQKKKNDKTARELWAVILKTFGGNEATKKTKKNLLKQQYGNFKAEGSETLEQTFNRLQVIVAKHSSGNEDGNTACVSTASTNVPTASASVATISQDTACAYIASQSSGSQNKFEDINQIDEDDEGYVISTNTQEIDGVFVPKSQEKK
nr:hypothetical protein [Tanacetum cinerariifolium]